MYPTKMNRRLLMASCVIASLIVSMVAPAATTAGSARLPADQTLQTVFVELSGKPSADLDVTDRNAQVETNNREHNEFRTIAKAERVKFTERYSYSKLFNGLSITVATADIPKLARMKGVLNIYPVVKEELPELHSSTAMIRATEVVADGYDGTGIKVGIIDTGIDYTHPDLGGCFGRGCRVIKGYDFVGDQYTGPGTPIIPDRDPMDQNGHGTHVAGIVGARAAGPNGVTGVAPGVSFLAYKVFGADGATQVDIMVAAMEQALDDDVDVVNMSIGSSFQWPQYPTAKAADRLAAKGVVVSVSAGNEGANGLIAGGAPSVGSKVMAVASYDNTELTVLRADLSTGSQVGYGIMTFAPDPNGQSFPVVPVPNFGNADGDYTGLNIAGKLALISRGGDTFANKVARAQRFGAAAVAVYNNVPGFFAGTLGTPDSAGTPWIYAVSLSKEDGNQVLAAGNVSITFTQSEQRVGNPTGYQISSFSSWGPSPDLTLKPDLGAPGGLIYSTYPLHLSNGYATLSGTSMAAPHATGAAALVLHAHPKLKGQQVQDLLMNTAVPKRYNNLPFLWPTNRQGAGMIDVLAAVYTPVRITPTKLSLGEFETAAPIKRTLTLENMSKAPVTYTVTHQSALSAYASYPNNPTVGLYTTAGTVNLSNTTVMVPAGKKAKVEVTITPPAGAPTGMLFGGYIFFSTTGKPTLTVPYIGWQGDYQAFSTLDYNFYGLPWLASLQEGYYYQESSMTLNAANGESAYVLLNLARQASKLRLTARSIRGKSVDQVLDVKYVGRNADPGSFFELSWDGRDRRGKLVPNGAYVLQLEVLRPLGDEKNPAHWDTWSSGVINVTGN